MPSPLHGYRVIDLTTMIAGPLATMMLGDQGADVIKVEAPARGDQTRAFSNRRGGLSASFINNNRNKRSIALDLKAPEGRELLLQMAADADVFVHNFRPGVAERLGIDERTVCKANDRLVYAAISGFGENGPLANRPAYDPIMQAITGLATVQAGSDEERPRLIRTILTDKVTAIAAAQAITAALLSRERTGNAQSVRLSMLDTVLAFLWASDMSAQTYVDEPIAQPKAASFIDLIYQTKDGYVSVAVLTDAQWAGLARALEQPGWLEDPRFRTAELRDTHIEERLSLTQAALANWITADAVRRLEAEDVPCVPVLTRGQVIRHPQVIQNEALIEYDHPDAGRLRQARPPARFSNAQIQAPNGAPRLGQHTDEILSELGIATEDIARLRQGEIIG